MAIWHWCGAPVGSERYSLYRNYAVVGVELIGDTVVESDETFCLDVTNPQGGGLGEGVVTLTAVRTIVNDDSFV
jgi:hypothetical protein